MSLEPVVAITMGDPAGVGPEVTAKALAREEVWERCRPLVVGDAAVLEKAAALVEGKLAFRPISRASEARFDPSRPDVLDLHNVDLAVLRPGQLSAAAGKASVEYVRRAVELTRAGQARPLSGEGVGGGTVVMLAETRTYNGTGAKSTLQKGG